MNVYITWDMQICICKNVYNKVIQKLKRIIKSEGLCFFLSVLTRLRQSDPFQYGG